MCSWHSASKGLHIFLSLHKFSHCDGTVWQAINRALFIIFFCIYSRVHKAKLMCIFPCLWLKHQLTTQHLHLQKILFGLSQISHRSTQKALSVKVISQKETIHFKIRIAMQHKITEPSWIKILLFKILSQYYLLITYSSLALYYIKLVALSLFTHSNHHKDNLFFMEYISKGKTSFWNSADV